MGLIRLPKNQRPPATKSGRLTPAKMRAKLARDKVYTSEDVDRCELVESFDKNGKSTSRYCLTMTDGVRKRLIRTTTVSGMLISQRLVDWSPRIAIAHIRANWEARVRYSQPQIDAICDGAETAHIDYKNWAADLGTQAHSLIETWLHTGEWPAEFAYYSATGEWPEWAAIDHRVGNSLMLFLNIWKLRKLIVIETEYRLFSVRWMVGGTADLIAFDEITGEYMLVDYKTGNGIYDSHLVQISFYYKALLEMGKLGFPISRVVIFRIGRTDALPQIYEVPANILEMAYECFELLAELRPKWVTIDGVLAKRGKEWRAANNLAAEAEDYLPALGEREAIDEAA